MFEDWMKFAFSAAVLGFEAQQVAAMRIMRMATGDHSENQRMVSEKLEAFIDAGQGAALAAAKGHAMPAIASGVLRTYRKRVRQNARRLRR
jgi:hypothetical protein